MSTLAEIHSLALQHYPMTDKVFLCHLKGGERGHTVVVNNNARNMHRINAIIRSVQPHIYKTTLSPAGMVQVFYRYPEEP